MKTFPQLLIALTLLGGSTLYAEQSGFITPEQSAALAKKVVATPVKTAKATASTAITTLGYLGIGFDTVPAPIRAHLPDNISPQQGLLVTRFATKSPAADDGLKVYDILLKYDDEPIIKPENFIQKIRQDKPGRIVKLTVSRQGEILVVPVTMGTQHKKVVAKKSTTTISSYQLPIGNNAPASNFNGLAIRKIGQDIYDASIGFVGLDGKPQRRSYKGNRMQILQQITQDTSLPAPAKQQLLFAVQPRQQQQQPAGWGMPNMPFMKNNGNGFNPNQFFKGFGW